MRSANADLIRGVVCSAGASKWRVRHKDQRGEANDHLGVYIIPIAE